MKKITEFLAGFIKNHFGNMNGTFKHSTKKVGFVLATYTAYIVPSVLLLYKVIDGGQWLDFYKIIIPSSLAIYAGGKVTDYFENKNQEK